MPRVSIPIFGALASLALPALPVAAAPAPISGRLDRPGYSVIALAADGRAKVVVTRRGSFRLRPTASRVTLHLRTPDGAYGGPVVLASRAHGTRAVVMVKAGARLGTIAVHPRRGYARVRRTPAGAMDVRRPARARKGIPRGAGSVGHVRSRLPRTPDPADLDLDGIPDPIDVDDDGDLTLDPLERRGGARSAQAGPEIFDLLTKLDLPLEDTANASAATPDSPLDTSRVDITLAANGRLLVEVLPGDSPELDCRGREFCSLGGTGRVFQAGVPPADWARFPDCCDADGDGFGALTGTAPPGGATPFMVLVPGATTENIRPGDMVVERVTRAGVETQFPTALPFIFVTVPALVSYDDDGIGPKPRNVLAYPVRAGGPGAQGHGLELAPGADGNAVTLEFWRPQRTPTPAETGPWIDIGGLTYTTIVQNLSTTPGEFGQQISKPCPQSAYTDPAPDGAPGASPPVTYPLNLTQCLASLGVSWSPGDELHLITEAVVPGGGVGASQGVWFRLR